MGDGADPREGIQDVKMKGRPVALPYRSRKHHWRQAATGRGVFQAGEGRNPEGLEGFGKISFRVRVSVREVPEKKVPGQ